MVFSRKKGQSAFEFVMLLGFALLFVLIIFYILQNTLLGLQKDKNREDIKQVANILTTELSLAESSPTQYLRSFSLPTTIRGNVYDISSPDGREIVIHYLGEQYVYFLSGQPLMNYTLLGPGENSLKKTCSSSNDCMISLYAPIIVNSNWWNLEYQNRKQVTITNVGTTALTNYPAYIKITKETNMLDDYSDVLFTNGVCQLGIETVRLEQEIESLESETYWWNPSFSKRKQITITNAGSTTLTNYLSYIKIQKASSMINDYSDVRFLDGSCSSATTQLNYELENYDSGNAHFWVKIPSFSIGTKQICMYYGDSYATSMSNPQSVWSSDYLIVQHFNEATGTSYDSTNNSNNINLNAELIREQGFIDGSVGKITNHTTSISHNDAISFNKTSKFTLSTWVKINASSNTWDIYTEDASIFMKGSYAPSYGISINHQTPQNESRRHIFAGIRNAIDGYKDVSYTLSNPSYSAWFQTVFTYEYIDDSTMWMRLYVDGILRSSRNVAPLSGDFNNTAAYSLMGNSPLGGNGAHAYGGFDEVRISNIVKSSDWIKQDYELIQNQNTLVTFGAEQSFTVKYAHAWVKIPTLFPGENKICMYYNNSLATSQSNPLAVWNSEHVFVQHLNEVSGTFFDSTNNSKHGSAYGGVTRGIQGKIGAGVSFDGTTGQVSILPTPLTNSFTFSTWAYYINHESGYAGLINALNGYNGQRNRILLSGSNTIYTQVANVTGSYDLSFAIPSTYKNSWRYYTITYDGQQLRAYFDGQPTGVVHNLTGNLITGTTNSTLGWGSQSVYHMNGYMDETRMYNVAKSADWINQDYELVQNQSTRVIFGEEENS